MAVIGSPRNFFKKYKFIVEIDGVAHAGFAKCSAITSETAKVEHWEGGAHIPDKSPGRSTFADVTLERGATTDSDLHSWSQQVSDAAANSGLVTPNYKRMVDIVQQDRDGSTLLRWRLHNAWPVSFQAGEWDNSADEVTIETTTLAYDYYERVAP